jgi:hypothetical protein
VTSSFSLTRLAHLAHSFIPEQCLVTHPALGQAAVSVFGQPALDKPLPPSLRLYFDAAQHQLLLDEECYSELRIKLICSFRAEKLRSIVSGSQQMNLLEIWN